jgi:hypothetical protein
MPLGGSANEDSGELGKHQGTLAIPFLKAGSFFWFTF